MLRWIWRQSHCCFVFLLQFFRGSLDLRRNFPVLNWVFLAGIAFYLLMVVLNVGSSLTYPSAPYLDLVEYPPDRAGPGIIKLKLFDSTVFVATAWFGNIVFSLVATRQQLREISDDFLLTTIPCCAHYRSNLFCFWVFLASLDGDFGCCRIFDVGNVHHLWFCRGTAV